MTQYTHLIPGERATIVRMRAQGASIAAIARQLGRARAPSFANCAVTPTRAAITIPTRHRTDIWPGAAAAAFSIASRNWAGSSSTGCMKTGRHRPSPAG